MRPDIENFRLELDPITESITETDRELLTAINTDGNVTLNSFWAMYTDKWTWIPFVLVIIFCLLYRGDWRRRLLIVASVALLFVLSDYVVASFIKNVVCRPRPSHDPAVMNLLTYVNGYHGGSYGFPSNHASNGFAAATFLTLLLRSRWAPVTTFTWAAGSCYSRMYMGVHYPTNILCGSLVGITFAFLVFFIYKRTAKFMHLAPVNENYSPRVALAIPVTFLLTLAVLLTLSLLIR